MERPDLALSDAWPLGDNEMAARVREYDWSRTPLGAVKQWSRSLINAVDLMLPVGFPMIVLWGPDLIQIYNDGYRALMGNKHPSGLGQPTRDCWPEVWNINAPIYERVRAGETLTFEDSLYPITRSGKLEDAWFTLTYSPLRDDRGAIAGVLVTLFETSNSIRHRRALTASEERYRAFVNASADVVYRMSPDWSEMRALDGRGFIADTVEPRENWRDSYNLPEDRPRIQEEIDRAIAARSMFALEHRVIRTDGSIGWTASRAVPILDDDGEIVEWLGTATDITDRKFDAERLRESEARFRMLADHISQLAWTCDHLGNVNWYNQRWLDYTGLSFEEMKSWGWEKVQHPDHVERVVAGVKRAAANGEPWEDTFPLRRHDGEYRWFYSQAAPIRDAHGEIARWFGTNTDVTDASRNREELRESQERQTFLLKLSDALRPVADPIAAQDMAVSLLGEALALDRCYYTETDWSRERVVVKREYLGTETHSLIGNHPLELFADLYRLAENGRPVVCDDISSDPALGTHAAAYHERGVEAFIVAPLMKNGRIDAFLCVTMERPRVWTSDEVRLVAEVAARTWAAVEQASAEVALQNSRANLQLLVAELQHRVRNILTVIRLTFSRTLQDGGTKEELADHFLGRLDAMARTQVALTRHSNRTANLEDLLRNELLSVGVHADGGAVTLAGPEVELDNKTAESLAMALHELTTNALKYGALSVEGASLTVSWRHNMGQGKQRILDIDWNEQGVPAIAVQPSRRGFGRELIEEALPYRLGAVTRLEFRGGGVRCAISVPHGTEAGGSVQQG